MSNKKQTAVEWLIEHIENQNKNGYEFHPKYEENVIQQAKELEKQQMEKCAIVFTNYAIDKIENKTDLKGEEQFEKYYTETYE